MLIAGYASSSTLIFLVFTYLFIGIGLGSLELGGSNIIVDLHNQNRGKYLNLLSFFYGVGSTIAPFYAGYLLNSSFSWRKVYQFSLIIVVLLPLYFCFTKYPTNNSSALNGLNFRHLGKTAFTKEMIWLYILIFAYVAAEIATASWLVEFLQKIRLQSIVISSTYLSMFFGCMMLGRLIGSFIVDKIGHVRIMTLFSIASLMCIIVGIFGPTNLAFFLPLTGFFFSIIFPTATAVVSKMRSNNLGTILGLFFSFGGIGAMIGPWIIGIFNDLLGLKLGMSMVAVFCIIVTISLIFLLKCKTEKSEAVY